MTWRAVDVLHHIALRVGAKVEYIGSTITRADGAESLTKGDIGMVVEVRPVDPPNASLVVDEDTGETYAGRDGHALVKWPNFRSGLIWPDGEHVRWRRAANISNEKDESQ